LHCPLTKKKTVCLLRGGWVDRPVIEPSNSDLSRVAVATTPVRVGPPIMLRSRFEVKKGILNLY
jgi:hypothetical protein